MTNATAATLTPALCQKTKARTGFINKRIGNTIYRVYVNFSETSKERFEDKILRLVQNDIDDKREVV